MAGVTALQGLVRRRDSETVQFEPTTTARLRAEADRLAGVLADEESALALAETALVQAEARLPMLAEIDADVAIGKLEAEVADEAKREIGESVERATAERSKREATVNVLRQRVAEAGRAVADEMERVASRPVIEARHLVREAVAILAARQTQLDAARTEDEEARGYADAVRAEFDAEERRKQYEKAKVKRDRLAWFITQPREAHLQLPHAWQEEFLAAWDEQNRRRLEYQRKVEQQRYGGAPPFDEPRDGYWREPGFPREIL